MGEIFLNSDVDKNEHNVVKSLKFDRNDTDELINHIKEFFLTDLHSALKIGPHVHRPLGFDFLIF